MRPGPEQAPQRGAVASRAPAQAAGVRLTPAACLRASLEIRPAARRGAPPRSTPLGRSLAEPAFDHGHDPVGDARQLLHLRGDQQHAHARSAALRGRSRASPSLALTSTPAVGSSRMRRRGFGRKPFGDDDLLLVAAAQLAGLLARRAADDPELAAQRRRTGRRRSPAGAPASGRRSRRLRRLGRADIGGERCGRSPALRRGGPPARSPCPRGSPPPASPSLTGPARDLDRARHVGQQAEQRLGQRRAAAADEPGDAQDLAAWRSRDRRRREAFALVRRPVTLVPAGAGATVRLARCAARRPLGRRATSCSAMRRVSVAVALIVGSSRPSLMTLMRSEILKISAMRWLM